MSDIVVNCEAQVYWHSAVLKSSLEKQNKGVALFHWVNATKQSAILFGPLTPGNMLFPEQNKTKMTLKSHFSKKKLNQ